MRAHAMRALAAVVLGLAFAAPAAASTGAALPYTFNPDTDNIQSMQRGARNYMNYCAGCHSMRHLRYARLAKDLDIPEGLVEQHLMFTSDKIGDPILSRMPVESAKWFGQQPPDLTVETRKRGPEWVYNYLLTFYVDPTRPTGVNNLVLPGASMPHVLWELQGWQVKPADVHAEGAVQGDAETAHGAQDSGHGAPGHKRGSGLVLAQPGTLTPEEYRKFVADTVNFMAYAAEPGKTGRIKTGIGVMLFLFALTVLSFLLKKEYWYDVH